MNVTGSIVTQNHNTEFVLAIPLHITSLGSGSHSLFPIHLVEFGPVSPCLGGQVNFTLSPSSDGLL